MERLNNKEIQTTPLELKQPVEALESWDLYENGIKSDSESSSVHHHHHRRYLKHHKKSGEEKRKELLETLWENPGIQTSTVHGMLIDAGSTGSRLHIYEWEPRTLMNAKDVNDAVSGRKLSFPLSQSRWTEELSPGLATLASRSTHEELIEGVKEYLSPLLEFAKTILHDKREDFDKFPIFLRATAGMRILTASDRARVLSAVRHAFSSDEYCPFYFQDEHARVLSGEEEAIFAWAGVNFLLGNLVQESIGSGTVVNPRYTYGALDLGGASTQISYYEHNEDIMADLFKLQIGQGKHWNVYAHSYLYYGKNEATNRFEARLAHQQSHNETTPIYNPCLPGGANKTVSSSIHFDTNGVETWEGSGFYQAILQNDQATGNYELCTKGVQQLLNLEKNVWCDFVFRGDCAFAGEYQPKLPKQESKHFGEFLAFSNYALVWEFLKLPERASLYQLENATMHVCSLSMHEVVDFGVGITDQKILPRDYCFISVYVFQLLRNGYGFQMNDFITAAKVVNGHKIGWALGAMLYEINTLPWQYVEQQQQQEEDIGILDVDTSNHSHRNHNHTGAPSFNFMLSIGMLLSLCTVFWIRRKRNQKLYEAL